jgi:hypothetical protein
MSRLKKVSLIAALLVSGCEKSDARRTILKSPGADYEVIVDAYSEGTALFVVSKGKELTKYSGFMNWGECNDVSLAWLNRNTLVISYDKIFLERYYSSGLEEDVRNFRPTLCDRRLNKCDADLKVVYKFDRCIYPY